MREVLVVGGGAAGMMAALTAAENGARVTVLERNEKTGKKVYITGKGRCNVTTACPPEDFLSSVVTNPRFLYSSFAAFNNQDMINYLNQAGLKTKVERGQRVFPESDRAADVIDTLKRECSRKKVRIHCKSRVTEVLTGDFQPDPQTRSKQTRRVTGLKLEDGEILACDALILACGGKSYPSTGSDGSGYQLAKELGHGIREPQPSLVPFVCRESWCRDLTGLSLKNVSVTVKNGKKKIYEGFGEMLFTHFGVSGPLILTASTCLGPFQKALRDGSLTLHLDLKPALDQEQLDQRFLRELDTWRNKKISNVIESMLPKKMVPVFISCAEMDENTRARDVTKKDRRRMVETMKDLTIHIQGVRGFQEAIVTRGGVNVREVDPSTMESRLVSGLYFAGELLDLDAVTGGYNLQIAWSTGRAAGKAAGGLF